jgi:hypothetical protein
MIATDAYSLPARLEVICMRPPLSRAPTLQTQLPHKIHSKYREVTHVISVHLFHFGASLASHCPKIRVLTFELLETLRPLLQGVHLAIVLTGVNITIALAAHNTLKQTKYTYLALTLLELHTLQQICFVCASTP